MKRTSMTRRGFTLSEILVALSISSIVLLGAYKLLSSQLGAYAQQVATEDDGETLRGAAAMLGWEIHHAEMATDDIWSTSQDTLSVRSIQGVGVVCVINSASVKYGIWKNGGDIEATAADSALVYVQATQLWKKLKIAAVGTPGAMGVANCSWAGLRPPDLVVQLTVASSADTAGIVVGSIFRSFRRTKFAEYQSSNRWYLARSVDGAAWETITGPLLPPTSHGLQFSYFDSSGVATTDTTKLRIIGVALRAQSYRRYKNAQKVTDYRVDSVITRVMIRR